MIEGVSGKKGGYRLKRKPEEYRVGDILRLTEGTLAPVSCLREDQEPCEKSDSCCTLPIWKGLADLIDKYFDEMTLADVLQSKHGSGEESSEEETIDAGGRKMSKELLLEVKNLNVSVEEKHILHDVNLEIGRHETHVLMGPNGTGKSTLGYTLVGNPRYQVESGEILFPGKKYYRRAGE